MYTVPPVSQEAPRITRRVSPARLLARGGRAVASLAAAAFLLVVVLPNLAGATLPSIRAALGNVSLAEVVGLTLLWAAGIYVHSFVLTGALPGLSRGRALTLNLTGSAVSNTLPFGGAAGMSLNYLMIRSWGVPATRFASFTLVTNLWVVLLKLSLPVIAFAGLAATSTGLTPGLAHAAMAAAALGAVAVTVAVLALIDERIARRLADVIAAVGGRIGRLVDRRSGRNLEQAFARESVRTAVTESRRSAVEVIAANWLRMSVGMLGYGLLQAVLLWAALASVGARVSPWIAFTAFAVDRMLTLFVATPGGLGIAEAGTAAVLVALHGPSAAIAAGVLAYRFYTYALEIPVGGLWLGCWALLRRLRGGHGLPLQPTAELTTVADAGRAA